jgi:replication initiation and membrane attachment protein DnaB
MTVVPQDYKPPHSIYAYATREGIPIEFVDGEVNNFITYWTLRKIRRKSWDLTFLNRIKHEWARQKALEKNTRKTMPSAYSEWEGEKIEKSKSTMSLAERLRQG